MKICPMGAELFLADRQTDVTQLIVAFPNFANAPKNGWISFCKTVRRRRENSQKPNTIGGNGCYFISDESAEMV